MSNPSFSDPGRLTASPNENKNSPPVSPSGCDGEAGEKCNSLTTQEVTSRLTCSPFSLHARAQEEKRCDSEAGEIVRAVHARFGIAPRAEQIEAIRHLLNRRDVLAVMRTGGGKSLAPQAVTAFRHRVGLGTTVYIGPLVALAQDMHRHCTALGLTTALWNGQVNETEKTQAILDIIADRLDILIITAESLASNASLSVSLREALCGKNGLCWIDEADTAVHDKNFRVLWAKLHEIVGSLNPAVIYCCTATCPPGHEAELSQRCGLRNPHVLRLTSDRENLAFTHAPRTEQDLTEILQRHLGQKTVIYTATAKVARRLFDTLNSAGYTSALYVGDLDADVKKKTLHDFITGEQRNVIATSAFARGVNIPNIHAIVCYDPPKSIAEFAQQAGRAGRDGKPSTIYLCSIYGEEGWQAQEFLAKSQFPEVSDLRRVWTRLFSEKNGISASQQKIAKACAVQSWKYGASAIFRTLTKFGLVEGHCTGPVGEWRAVGNFEALDWTSYREHQKHALDDLQNLKELWALPSDQIRAALIHNLDEE